MRNHYYIELRKHNDKDFEVIDLAIISEYTNYGALIEGAQYFSDKFELYSIDEGMMVSKEVTTREMWVVDEDNPTKVVYYTLEIISTIENVEEVEEGVFLMTSETLSELLKYKEIREIAYKMYEEKDFDKKTLLLEQIDEKIKEIYKCNKIVTIL